MPKLDMTQPGLRRIIPTKRSNKPLQRYAFRSQRILEALSEKGQFWNYIMARVYCDGPSTYSGDNMTLGLALARLITRGNIARKKKMNGNRLQWFYQLTASGRKVLAESDCLIPPGRSW